MMITTETVTTATLTLDQMEIEFLKFLIDRSEIAHTTGKFRECRDKFRGTLGVIKNSGNHSFQAYPTPRAPEARKIL
jgi:hypothetical protein